MPLCVPEPYGGCPAPSGIRPTLADLFAGGPVAPLIRPSPINTRFWGPKTELPAASGMYPDTANNLIKAGVETNPGPEEATRHFKLAHVNINSITAGQKRDELELFAESNGIKVLALSETKLDETIHPSRFAINNFQSPLVRHRNRSGGGVAIYFHTSLAATRLPDLEIGDEEWIWAKVRFGKISLVVCSIYIPPNLTSDRHEEFVLNFAESLSNAQRYNPTAVIIMGDFNAGNCFLTNTLLKHSPISTFEWKLKSIAESLSLSQLIKDPTRMEGSTHNLRDLIFISDISLVAESGLLSSFSTIDHFPIYLAIEGQATNPRRQQKTIWDYSKLDPQRLTHQLMTTNWNEILDNDTDTATSLFTSTLSKAAEDCIPRKTVPAISRDKSWVTGELKKLIRKRNRLFRIAKTKQEKLGKDEHNHYDWDRWRRSRNEVTKLTRQLKSESISKDARLLLEKKHEPHKYHSILRRMTGRSKTIEIPPLQNDNGDLVIDDKAKAELLNQYFAAQTQLPNSNNHDLPNINRENVPPLNMTRITEMEVLKTINGLNQNKSTGPDGIPVRFIKLIAIIIAEPLSLLFNKSVQEGKFPEVWKIATVKPIFKNKGSTADVSSYRPISLLCSISKIFEKIMFRRIYQHLIENDLLTERQSGYRPGHGTHLQLFYITHSLYELLDNGQDVTILYFDISRYFEKIWHKGLLHKCEHEFGLTNILPWLRSYLTDRRQAVQINETKSSLLPLNAGCPQGSVTGPLLALLYLNALSGKTQNEMLFFADDACLISSHNPENIQNMQQLLQNDITQIQTYGNDWLIKFNASKTIQQSFSYRNESEVPNLNFDANPIPVESKHKHLGITLSTDLRFHHHVNYIVRKVIMTLSPLYPIAPYLPREILTQIYKTYVLPHFDYGDVIYDGLLTVDDTQRLERLQNRAARLVTSTLPRTSTENLRRELGWSSLKTRRELHKICFCHRLYQGTTPNYIRRILPATRDNTVNRLLRNARNRNEMPFRTSNFSSSFLPSTIKLINKLPTHITEIESHKSFKKHMNERYHQSEPPEYFSFGTKKENSLLTRLRVGMSYLNGHLYKIQGVETPRCACGYYCESSEHFLLQCPRFDLQRQIMMNNISDLLDGQFENLHRKLKTDILLCGGTLHPQIGRAVAQEVFRFVKTSQRFDN